MARRRHRKNPGIGTGTALLLAGVGAYFFVPSVKAKIDSVIGGGGGGGDGGGGGGGSGGMTSQQACDAAKVALAALDGSWNSKTCDQIKAKVCSDRTLFVNKDTSSADYKIRQGLGCPL